MTGCARRAELESLLRFGHWPDAAGAELVAHVRNCRKCSEVALLTQALTASRAAAVRQAPVEPPAVLWWRAQLRRREVIQQVERPIRAHMLIVLAAVCVGLGVTFELAGGASPWRGWMQVEAVDVVRSSVGSLGLDVAVASIAALGMMAAVAVYLTTTPE